MTGTKINPADMTKDQAALHFKDLVAQRQREHGTDLIVEWALVRALYPTLYSKAFSSGSPSEPFKVQTAGSYTDSSGITQPLVPLPYITGAPSNRGNGLASSLRPQKIAIPNHGTFTEKVWPYWLGKAFYNQAQAPTTFCRRSRK